MKNSPIKAITNYGVVYQTEMNLNWDIRKVLPCITGKMNCYDRVMQMGKRVLISPCSNTEISKAFID